MSGEPPVLAPVSPLFAVLDVVLFRSYVIIWSRKIFILVG